MNLRFISTESALWFKWQHGISYIKNSNLLGTLGYMYHCTQYLLIELEEWRQEIAMFT